MLIQVDRMYAPVTTLGYGRRFGIWTIGCPRHCKNCSNPELQTPNPAKAIDVKSILRIVSQYADSIDGITITGGDPLMQPDALRELLIGFEAMGIRDVLVYTGYTMAEINLSSKLSDLLPHIGVLIDGPYIDDLNDNKSIRGSSNQKIWLLRDELSDRYLNVEQWERKTQVINSNNSLYAIGIPKK